MSEDFQNSASFPGQPRNMTVFEERRQRTDDAILLHIKELQSAVRAIDDKLSQHLEEEEAALAKTMENLLKNAFPDSDPDGHRRAHEAWIKKEEDRAEFWSKMRIALAQYGLFGFAGWAVYYLWKAFLMGPK